MKIKTDPAGIWGEYQDGQAYKSSLSPSVYDTVRQNESFYIGNQWEGVNAPDLDKPVFNILRRVVTFFISSIVSDDIAVRVQEFTENPENKNTLSMLTQQFGEIMELSEFKSKSRDAIRNAAVDCDGCLHYYFDPGEPGEDTMDTTYTPGHIEAELLDNTNVYFGDTQTADVKRQPYIILSFRRRLDVVKETAKEFAETDADQIVADQDDENMSTGTDRAEMVTVLRKYYREKDVVHFTEVTQKAVVRPPTSMEMRHYPVVWMPWEKIKNSYHGQAAVTGMIPNQIFINKMFAMAMQHIKLMAFPKAVYNKQLMPDGWDNRVGAAVGVNGNPNDAIASGYRVPDMSNQVMLMLEKVVQHTRDTMGASDAALGNIRPDNTSAIIATQKATSMPLELQKMEFYRFVEASVRVWLDMMGQYYGVRLVNMVTVSPEGEESAQSVPFDFSQLRGLELRLNVDIGSATYWSELMQVQTLDNLFSQGIIQDAELYLELVPAAYIPNKQRIMEYLQKKKAQAMQPPAGGDGAVQPPAGGLPPELAQMMQQAGGGM